MRRAVALNCSLNRHTEYARQIYHNWGERSEPHTCGENGKLSIYMFIYIYGTCVFRIYIHPAPFVRDAIFPHCMLVHVTTVAQETRLAGQKG